MNEEQKKLIKNIEERMAAVRIRLAQIKETK